MHRRDILAGGAAALATASFPSLAALAEVDYPKQPIRLVVPRSAGGGVDIVARLWADQAKQRLGNIIIEKQGGGGRLIGASTLARANPPGSPPPAGTPTQLSI